MSFYHELSKTNRISDAHFYILGIDCFKAQVNIEVQYANEQVIAAVERNGGTITTAFYDLKSVFALSNPKKFFLKGLLVHGKT